MSDITTGTELDGSLGTITRTNGDISSGVAMSGAIAPPQALSGDVTTSLSLAGSLSSLTAPDGSVAIGNEIEGQMVGGPKGDTGATGPQGDPGVVQSIVAGSGISVDVTDPANPIVTNTQTSAEWGNITGTLSSQTDLNTALANKVDKVAGKQLSTNDYTNLEKTKLAGIEDEAEKNVNSDWNAVSGDAQILNKPTVPTKTSDITNDSGFITTEADPTVPAWAKTPSKPTYTKTDVGLSNVDNTSDLSKPISTATQAALDAKTSTWGSITGTLSSQTDLQSALNLKANTSSLATVATSGSYNDLTSKPTIPDQFNPIAGTNVTLSGSYPNITFNASGGSSNTNERLQNEDRDATYAYVGYENTSDSSWYIYRRTRATNVREYASGVSNYATNWTNRASLTYS